LYRYTVAFQKPKVQAAVMDCSSNPNNIMKYQVGLYRLTRSLKAPGFNP
jgi:hypothetical protein